MSAISLSKRQLRHAVQSLPETASLDVAPLIDTHLLMLDDQSFSDESARIIKETFCNAEWALKQQRDYLLSIFDEMEDQYLRTRREDVKHVVDRIVRNLDQVGPSISEVAPSGLTGAIVLADDLSPADVILLRHRGVVGFATELGGTASHTSILARSLAIPAVMGLRFLKDYFKENDTIVLDGEEGVLLGEADEKLIGDYEIQRVKLRNHRNNLKVNSGNWRTTLDGIECSLYANIEISSEFADVSEIGAKGVGLYRTEFLFVDRGHVPDETEHYENYVKALGCLRGKELTIRTVDLEWEQHFPHSKEGFHRGPNPALGVRGIRVGLRDTELLTPQLRAIVRASAYGSVRLMLPMVSAVDEIRRVKEILVEIQDEFKENGISFDQMMPVGAMIEVPAAAVCADLFAKELDFLAIGSNDLTQYAVAVDRDTDEVGNLQDPLHPAVLRLLETTIVAARNNGVRVSLCGELASNIKYTRVLLGLGLTEFSVCPTTLLEVKEIISRSSVEKVRPYAKALLNAGSLEERGRLLAQLEML